VSGSGRPVVVVVARPSGWHDETVACLADNGFAVVEDPTGSCAFDHRARTAAAAVVELDGPAGSASEILRAWRSRSAAAVFAIGDTNDEAAVLAAYAAGADHVAPVDVSARQLLARVRAALRTSPVGRPRAEVVAAPVRIDAERMVAVVGDVEVALTPAELDVLHLMVERSGRLLTRAALRSMVDGLGSSERSVDFFIRRLRAKLEQAEGVRRIQVVRGVGFRFDAGALPSPARDADGSHAAI
jgi:two-component system response regulator RegX3